MVSESWCGSLDIALSPVFNPMYSGKPFAVEVYGTHLKSSSIPCLPVEETSLSAVCEPLTELIGMNSVMNAIHWWDLNLSLGKPAF